MLDRLSPVVYSDQRILTTAQIAESYGTDEKIIRKNFERNQDHYTLGKHYFVLEGEELKKFKEATRQIDVTLKFASILYLWTKKGAFLHAKSLNTDKAWELYEQLTDFYFDQQESTQLVQQPARYSQTLQGLALYQLLGNPADLRDTIIVLESEMSSLEENLAYLRENERRLYPDQKRQRKTHCVHGHPYDGGNAYVDADGYRECRICRSMMVNRHREK